MKIVSLRLDAYIAYLILVGVGSVLRGLIYTVVAVYYVSVVRMNPLQLVLVGTVLEATILVFEVPTGAIADVLSRRLAVILGEILFGVAFILEGMVPLVAAILIAEGIRGIGESFNSGALQALVSGEVGDARIGQVFLRGAQVSRLGFLVGIAGSVGLASIRLNLPIVLGGILSVGLGVFVLVAMPERGFQPPPRARRTSLELMATTVRDGVRLAWGQPLLRTFVGLAACFGLASEGIDRLWEAHMLANFVFPSLGRLKPVVWFGIIEAAATVWGIGALEFLRRRVNTQQPTDLARVLLAAGRHLDVRVDGTVLASAGSVLERDGHQRGGRHALQDLAHPSDRPARPRDGALDRGASGCVRPDRRRSGDWGDRYGTLAASGSGGCWRRASSGARVLRPAKSSATRAAAGA